MPQQITEAETPTTFNAFLEIGWLLIAIITPLWVYFGGQRPFDPQKIFLFRSLLWLLVTLLCAHSLLRPQRPSLRHKPMLVPVVFLACVWLLATATAVSPQQSWWGSYERGQGSLTQLSYLLLFWLIATRLRTLAQSWRLLTALALTALPLLLLSLAQASGWQPLPLLTDARSPLYATLGRANFLAAYLVILLPLLLALGWHWRGWRRHGSLTLLLAALVVIALTQARAAWLAALVALGLFGLLWWGRTWRGRHWLAVGLAAAAVSGPLLILLNIAQGGSLAARLTIWRAAAALVRQRPLWGYGLDSLDLIFPRVYPPQLVYYQGREFFVDRAHNLLLDWAITTGLVGVGAQLLFWGLFWGHMRRAWQQTADPQRRLLLIAIVCALVGNLTHTLTSFDVTATAVAVWLLLGLGVAISQPQPGAARAVAVARWRWGVAGLVLGLGMAAMWWANGRLFLADRAAYQAQQLAQRGQIEAAISLAQKASHYAPHEPAYAHQLAQFYWQQIGKNEAAWAQTEAALLTARDLRPMAYGRWLALAEFYAASTVELGTDTAAAADDAYAQAAQLAPQHSQVYTAWGQFDWVRGAWETAVTHWQRAAALDATNAPAHAYLAQAYWRAGETDRAATALAQALKYDPHNQLALALQQQMRAGP